MQALSVRKTLARILKMCLWSHYNSENVTESIVKPVSISRREKYLNFCTLALFAELLSQLQCRYT